MMVHPFALVSSFLGVLGQFITPLPLPVQAATLPSLTVWAWQEDGTATSFTRPTANAASGASLIAADLGNDGVDELLVGSGLGNEPRVRVLRQDGSEIGNFLAYAPTMGVGLNLAACDLDGDTFPEIVVAPQKGGGPHVRIFSRMGTAIDQGGFFADDEADRYGLSLACGDLDNDGHAELVTLPTPGKSPRVRVWKHQEDGSMRLHTEFLVGEETDRRGLIGLIQDGSLFLATQQGAHGTLFTYRVTNVAQRDAERAIPNNDLGLASLVSNQTQLFATSASGNTILNLSTGAQEIIDSAYGSVTATYARKKDGNFMRFTTEARPLFGGEAQGHSIVVDLSEQRLFAYEDGVLANTFLVSTARAPYTTPLGKHRILAKVPQVHYAGTNPDGSTWDLGWVPYNLRFAPHIYIHYAYWHNNFGTPMSHGCVNVNLENIKWIYDWAQESDAVEVRA